jgi:WD40 repeat protein
MTLSPHTDTVRDIAILDESRICSCSMDNSLKIWNITTGVCERTLQDHTECVTQCFLLEDGRLCSVSEDGVVKLWNVNNGVCEQTINHDKSRSIDVLVQLRDGRPLSSGNSVLLWN